MFGNTSNARNRLVFFSRSESCIEDFSASTKRSQSPALLFSRDGSMISNEASVAGRKTLVLTVAKVQNSLNICTTVKELDYFRIVIAEVVIELL